MSSSSTIKVVEVSSHIDAEIIDSLLPSSAFTSTQALDAEEQLIFRNAWMNIGQAAQVPNTGDMRTLKVFGIPLLISRDAQGQVNVFYNVCRHRGHILEAEPLSNRRMIACKYHSWSYDLEGNFRGAPCWEGKDRAAPSPEAKAELGLKRVRSAVWLDSIFINLSGCAEPFEQFIKPLATRWQPYDLSRFYMADVRHYEAGGNWKLAVENFLDSYHFPTVHREFGDFDVMRRHSNLRVGNDAFGYHMPTGEADKPKVGTPLPTLDVPDTLKPAQDIVYLYPNSLLIITASWLQIIALLPDGPGKTQESMSIYLVDGHQDDQGVQETARNFIKTGNYINEQDMPVLVALQAGANSGVTGAGKYIGYWDENPYHFHRRLTQVVDYQALPA